MSEDTIKRNRDRVEAALNGLMEETREFAQEAIQACGRGQLYIDRMNPYERRQIKDVNDISSINDPAAYVALLMSTWDAAFAGLGMPKSVNFALADKIRHIRNAAYHHHPEIEDEDYVEEGLYAIESMRRALTGAARERAGNQPEEEAAEEPEAQGGRMPYTADISRLRPTCFLFLLDQSGSMTTPMSGRSGERKKDMAAQALNKVVDELTQRCSQGMDVRDYFEIGIIGYTTDPSGRPIIRSLLKNTTPASPFLRISQVVNQAVVEKVNVKESDGAGGVIEVTRQIPTWVKGESHYGTPMAKAFEQAAEALEEWTRNHRDSYPATVINISDGIPTDSESHALNQAGRIRNASTQDGKSLLLNIHLSEMNAAPCQYPGDISRIPQGEKYAALMFEMSSVLPESNRRQAENLDLELEPNARGYVFNADMASLVQFLNIGTRAANSLK